MVRSPTLTKGISGVSVKGSRPERLHLRPVFGHHARRVFRDGGGDGADMVGGGAAAAADDVEQALAGEFLDLRRHEVGALVVLAEGVGQAGIGIGAGEGIGDAGDLGEMRAHRLGAERAVEADGEGAGVADRVPEGGRGLAGEGAAGEVGDGAGDHDRQAAGLGEDLLAGEDRGLGVERVEDGLDQDQVGAAGDRPRIWPV